MKKIKSKKIEINKFLNSIKRTMGKVPIKDIHVAKTSKGNWDVYYKNESNPIMTVSGSVLTLTNAKQFNLLKMKKTKAKVLKASTKQIGKSVMKLDKQRKAKAPGKRRSSTGNVYYEYRKNRTDVKGRDTPKPLAKGTRNKLNRLKHFINNVVKETKIRDKLYSVYLPLPTNYKFANAKKAILNEIEIKKHKINRQSKELEIKRQVAWEDKQERKIDSLKRRIKNAKFISSSAMTASDRISNMIPFGQPILVGHHSQRRHERHIEKMQNDMRKSFTEAAKAERLEDRLKTIQTSTVISGDDPQAIAKLKRKLDLLEKQRVGYKEHNKKARKDKNLQPLASWHLTNLGATIRNVKQRIEKLIREQAIKPISLSKSGVDLKVDKVQNRVMLIFDDKPNYNQRSSLKSTGFKWSPRNNAWQKQLSVSNINSAKKVYSRFPDLDGGRIY